MHHFTADVKHSYLPKSKIGRVHRSRFSLQNLNNRANEKPRNNRRLDVKTGERPWKSKKFHLISKDSKKSEGELKDTMKAYFC